MDGILTKVLLLLSGGSLTWYLFQKLTIHRPPLPPGPPADPLIGHLRIFPTNDQEVVFHDWSQKYGDVMCLRVPGQTIIVLDSHDVAVDLLEKRSALYSCRPSIVVYELMGWSPAITLLQYGPRFRKHRKLLVPAFTRPACVPFQQIQVENVHLLVDQLLQSKGENFEHSLSRFSTAVIMRIAFGHQVLSDDDKYIKIATNVGHALHAGGLPGATPVDWLPFLQYMPSWFPGTHYANIAREWRWAIRELYEYPYDMVQRQIDHGTAKYSFLMRHLEAVGNNPLNPEEADDLKSAAALLYTGGAETTWSALSGFFMAMLLYPECQKRAQDEIDQVIGESRLPTFDDQDMLPYVTGVVYEILRWGRVSPLGAPHRSTQDDIYRGMFIPKGSLIFANTFGMSLDEKMYKDPKTFNPARFMSCAMGGNEEPQFWDAFGFGRRICPGRHLALASVWIAVATILATLNLTKAVDENGQEIIPAVEFNAGITSHPKPFPCIITPRSRNARKLVTEAVRVIS